MGMNLYRVEQVARYLDIPQSELREVGENMKAHCERLWLHDPAKGEAADRQVLNMNGRLRRIQHRIYHRFLLPHLDASPYSHGAVKGGSIKTNAQPHLASSFALAADISGFYPSIHHTRVYRFFVEQFGCSTDVASCLTKLTTVYHHLALGLITSPILANAILKPVDRRIAGACTGMGLRYTRFVDDIFISGDFDLAPRASGAADLIQRILQEHGFRTKASKWQAGPIERVHITKLRIRNGKLDVGKAYADALEEQIEATRQLAMGGDFDRLFATKYQVWGQINFIAWVNRGRRYQLWKKFRAVNWKAASEEARRRGLVRAKKVLVPAKRAPA